LLLLFLLLLFYQRNNNNTKFIKFCNSIRQPQRCWRKRSRAVNRKQ